MTPVVRIDDEVMDELKKRAVDWCLVFSTPNEVLRAVFGLGKQENIGVDKFIDIEIKNPAASQQYHFIPISKGIRRFFPGYKLPFVLETDLGEIRTHITSAPKGTRIGDPDGGAYIQSGLRKWFDAHQAQLANGATLHIEASEPGKRYKLSIGNRAVLEGRKPLFLISLPLSFKGEGDKGGEGDNRYRYTVYNWQ